MLRVRGAAAAMSVDSSNKGSSSSGRMSIDSRNLGVQSVDEFVQDLSQLTRMPSVDIKQLTKLKKQILNMR